MEPQDRGLGHVAAPLRSELVGSALQMAQTQRRAGRGLLVHSDRGVPYASRETRAFLAAHGWQASMSRSGNPCDNAWRESAIGKLKREVLGGHGARRSRHRPPATLCQHRVLVQPAPPSQRLGYKSPVAFEAQFMNN